MDKFTRRGARLEIECLKGNGDMDIISEYLEKALIGIDTLEMENEQLKNANIEIALKLKEVKNMDKEILSLAIKEMSEDIHQCSDPYFSDGVEGRVEKYMKNAEERIQIEIQIKENRQ